MSGFRWFLVVAVLLGALANGCGGSDGSGVPTSTKLSDLTPDQTKAECDYINGLRGGYARRQKCSDGLTASSDVNQDFCIHFLPGLGLICADLTVGDYEGCASQSGTNLCAVETGSACAALRTCLPERRPGRAQLSRERGDVLDSAREMHLVDETRRNAGAELVAELGRTRT